MGKAREGLGPALRAPVTRLQPCCDYRTSTLGEAFKVAKTLSSCMESHAIERNHQEPQGGHWRLYASQNREVEKRVCG